LKKKDIISLEDNNLPKGLTPMESYFLSIDVNNKNEGIEEEYKRNIGNTIPMNLRTQEDPKILKNAARCS